MMKLMATTIPPVLNKLCGAFRGIFFTRKVLIFLFVHKNKCVCVSVCACVWEGGGVGGMGGGSTHYKHLTEVLLYIFIEK